MSGAVLLLLSLLSSFSSLSIWGFGLSFLKQKKVIYCSASSTLIGFSSLQGGAERQVLVKDYETGKTVAFEKRVSNLKEVYTAEGYKM